MSQRTSLPLDHSDVSRSVAFNESNILYTPQSSSASSSRTRKLRKGQLVDSDDEDMDGRRSPFHRPVDARAADGRSHQPLLHKQDEERGRLGFGDGPATKPPFSRRSTMRSRSPDTQAKMATKKKYTYAAFFLVLSLISFTIQTETAVYIQHELHWDKAYCMLYVEHLKLKVTSS